VKYLSTSQRSPLFPFLPFFFSFRSFFFPAPWLIPPCVAGTARIQSLFPPFPIAFPFRSAFSPFELPSPPQRLQCSLIFLPSSVSLEIPFFPDRMTLFFPRHRFLFFSKRLCSVLSLPQADLYFPVGGLPIFCPPPAWLRSTLWSFRQLISLFLSLNNGTG